MANLAIYSLYQSFCSFLGPFSITVDREVEEKIHNFICTSYTILIRDGPIPVSVSEISAHFSVSAVSVSAIGKCCRYADTEISAVRSVSAHKIVY